MFQSLILYICTGGRKKFEDPDCTKGPSGKVVYVPRRENAGMGMREEFELVSEPNLFEFAL